MSLFIYLNPVFIIITFGVSVNGLGEKRIFITLFLIMQLILVLARNSQRCIMRKDNIKFIYLQIFYRKSFLPAIGIETALFHSRIFHSQCAE